MEFRSVLYIPGMAPLSNEEIMNPKTKNIRLYVKRVFISDDFDGELVCCHNFFILLLELEATVLLWLLYLQCCNGPLNFSVLSAVPQVLELCQRCC